MGEQQDRVDFDTLALRVHYICITVLCLKTLLMSILTARLRFKKKIVITPEDKAILKGSKVVYNNADIERVRRAHRNDLENIPIFISSGFFYAFTNPNQILAILLFLAYTFARCGHTYVYAINVKPQPARFLCFAVGYAINLFMAGSVIYHIGFV